jgi:hypothetical protein
VYEGTVAALVRDTGADSLHAAYLRTITDTPVSV